MSLEDYRNQPRRRFSREFKRELVELLLERAATVAEVARDYDVHPNQLCRWRKEYVRGQLGEPNIELLPAPEFLPVQIASASLMTPQPMHVDPVARPAIPAKGDHRSPEFDRHTVPRCGRLRVMLKKGEVLIENCDAPTLRLLIESLQ